ncbi:MAG: hypothetical protein V4675_03625 [Verrucomicrobiota bacterium]
MSASKDQRGFSSGGDSPELARKLSVSKEELQIKAKLLAETKVRYTKLTLRPPGVITGKPTPPEL